MENELIPTNKKGDNIMSRTYSEVSKAFRDLMINITANYETSGAPFKPFMLKAGTAADFTSIWSNQEWQENDIRFFGFNGKRQDGCLPLGDVAVPSKSLTMDEAGTLFFAIHPDCANDEPAPLKHPDSFEWILDDYGTSGNDKNLFYWRPVPPSGYSALGICFTPTATPPDRTLYWCVSNNFVEEVDKILMWEDKGMRWEHNGNLLVPALRDDQLNGMGLGTGQVRIIPRTFFSEECTAMRPLAVCADATAGGA
jgi:VPS62-like protein